MRNNKRRDVLTHARVNFCQSETTSLLRVGELNFELLLWRGVKRKDPSQLLGKFFKLVDTKVVVTQKRHSSSKFDGQRSSKILKAN